MFKVIAMTENEVAERQATFSHRNDAELMANTWANFHDLTRVFATDDMRLISEISKVGTAA